MPFTGILGHQRQLEILRWSLEKERLHHAYLFLGPEGVGKKTVALSLAMAIHCAEKAHDFCARCIECVRIQSGNHPDVRVIAPLAGKKEISIQQVRDLERELSFRAFSRRKKVAIVDSATRMNIAAQNALLKTLEEPPEDSLLILIAPSSGGLLPTLRSRCLRIAFGPLPKELVATFLVNQKGLKTEEAETLAALSMGSLGRAISGELEDFLERRRLMLEKIRSLARQDFRGALTLAEELSTSREGALKFLEWMEGWYRDILICAASEGRSAGICNIDLQKEVGEEAARQTLERLLYLLTQVIQTESRIQRNVNRRMALENLFIRAAS